MEPVGLDNLPPQPMIKIQYTQLLSHRWSHYTSHQKKFNSQKNWVKPNSIKNHTYWMSTFEF